MHLSVQGSLTLLVICVFHHNCCLTNYITNPRSTQRFLLRILQQEKLNSCKLMFLGHEDHEKSLVTVSSVAHSSKISYYNVLFNVNGTVTDTSPQGKTLSKVQGLPVTFPPRIQNHNKRSGQCFVIVITILHATSEFMKQIFNMITPIYLPKTRKGEDYYIYLTASPEESEKVLKMRELPARTKYKIAVSESEDAKLDIRSVCFFCNAGSPTFVQFHESDNVDYFPDFVIHLNGKTLIISVPAMTSRIEIDKSNPGLQNAKRGLWKNLFEDFLGKKFNFTYRMKLGMANGPYREGGTGVMAPDGSWSGVVGDLYYGNADVGVLTSRTTKRIFYIDVSDPFFDVNYLIFVTSEGTRVYSPLALFWPFDEFTWLLIALSTLLSFGVFKFLLSSIEFLGMNTELSFTRRGVISKNSWGLSHQIQLIISSFLEQDCVMPSFGPLRCYVAFFLFFTLILISAYKSKLVSLMAFPVTQKLPQSFAELAYSDYDVIFMRHGDSALNTLKASTDPVYVKLIAEMEIMSDDGLVCLQKVVAEKYSCIAYEFSITFVRERNLSDSDTKKLVFAPDHTYNIFCGLSFEGGSIYKRNFDKWLKFTRAMHFADIWERNDFYNNVRKPKLKWWQETSQMDKAKKLGRESSILILKQILGAFWVLIGGILIGLCIFMIELCNMYLQRYGEFKNKGKLSIVEGKQQMYARKKQHAFRIMF